MKNTVLFMFFLSFICTPLFSQVTPRKIHFKAGTISITESKVMAEPPLKKPLIVPVWVNEDLKDAWTYLNGRGYQVLSKLSDRAYIIRADQQYAAALAADADIAAIFKIPGYIKLSNNVATATSGMYKVSLYAPYTGTDITEVLTTEISIVKENISAEINFVDIRCDRDLLERIADLPFVSYITAIPAEYQIINNRKESMESAAEAHADIADGGMNLKGSGITLGIGDDGYFNHVDLNDRVLNFSPIPTDNGHSPHVHGILGGAGLLAPLYRGKVYEATLVSAFFYDIVSNASAYYSGNQMRATNNSYGVIEYTTCAEYGDYNTYSEEVDAQAQSMPDLLHVFAAGNQGGDNCSPYSGGYNTVFDGPQAAKNTLVVGALGRDIQFQLAPYSSKGPVDDGRLKPELSAMGQTRSTGKNNDYISNSGTSMASPSVAGAVGLMQEAYLAQHGSYPRLDLLKAVLCNTADDIYDEGPDFGSGFGKLNTTKAAKQISGSTNVLGSIAQSGQNDINITVPSNAKKIAITLSWIDPPANPTLSQVLVNDLDMQLIGGSTYLPWILDPSPGNSSAPATRGADHLNNIEKISVLDPAAGSYTIRVSGTSVMGTQNYALTYYIEAGDMRISSPFTGEKYAPGDLLYLSLIHI